MFRSKRGLDDGFCADPSLQKRQRLPQGAGLALHPYNENSTHFGNELLGDGNRRKRSRGFGEDCGAGLAEQRMLHMQQQVQQRDDEIAKLRQMLAQRDAQLADKRRLLDAAVAHCSELNTAKESVVRAAQDALGQNKILKRGVAIQVRSLAARFARSSPAPSTGLRVCAFACAAKLLGSSPSAPLACHMFAPQQAKLEESHEKIKALEHRNFALAVHLQSAAGGAGIASPRMGF